MPRSIWKGPFIEKAVFKAVKKQHKKIWSRKSVILPQFEGNTFNVHNGKEFIPVLVKEDMVGHKFGEFAQTRKTFSYKKTKNK